MTQSNLQINSTQQNKIWIKVSPHLASYIAHYCFSGPQHVLLCDDYCLMMNLSISYTAMSNKSSLYVNRRVGKSGLERLAFSTVMGICDQSEHKLITGKILQSLNVI